MSKKVKVVVIDDEEDFCFFARENLMMDDMFEVYIATNGRYGIKLAIEEKPDIVLLDLVMPDMPGEDVADALKKDDRTSDIPIVFVTALASENDIDGGKSGNSYMLAKPVRTKTLIETIQKVLN